MTRNKLIAPLTSPPEATRLEVAASSLEPAAGERYIYIYIYMDVYVYVCNMYAYIHTHTHTHMHTHREGKRCLPGEEEIVT